MAKLFNLARMTTATTGTGTITLGSAVTGFLSFAAAGVGDGETVTYAIQDGAASEIGRGVYTSSGTTLTRSVLKSTNGGNAINLSGQAQVFVTASAEDFNALPNTLGAYNVSLAAGTNVTANRTLTLTTGDANRTLTISANATVSQDYSTSGSPQFATIELGAASDTTISRSSAGVIAVEGVTVPLNSTTSTHTAQQIELGHATDTTITRVSAGVISVEGSNVILASNKLSALSATSSSELAGVISDETGSGALVFGTSPTFTTSTLHPAGSASAPSLAASGDTNTGIWFPAADTIAASTGGSARVRIDSSGNVGIGTTNPSKTLHVYEGTAAVANTTMILESYASGYGAGIEAGSALTGGSYKAMGKIVWDASDTWNTTTSTQDSRCTIWTTEDGTLTERLRITSSGNVGIGTTGPGYQLTLSTDSAAKPTTNTWTIASDARLKNVTGEYTKGLNAVCALRPVTYTYNGLGGMPTGGGEHISILAQEAMVPFPECVGTYRGKLDPDGEETDIYNWNGHALTFALVNAVKELRATITALEARIAALEA